MEYSEPRNLNNHSRHRQLPSDVFTWFLAVACVVICAHCACGQQTSDQNAIQKLLNDQVESWNRGDIDGYMQGYWASDSTVFTSGGTITKGYREVLSRYKKSYDGREKMGNLEFRDLVIEQLSPVVAVAMGVWQLTRDSDKPWGRFTLIFEKKPAGWRITHDHTSSAGH